jgi:uncharacterized protein YjbI with pentapeptide repeats
MSLGRSQERGRAAAMLRRLVAWPSTRRARLVPTLIGLLLGLGFVAAGLRAPRDQVLPLTVVVAIVLGLAGMLWAIVVIPRQLHPPLTDADLEELTAIQKVERREDRRRLQNETRTTLIQAIGGIVLVAGLVFTWQQLQTDRDQQRVEQAQLREQLELSRQGQAAERFTQAVEQLASDKLDVRLGGIYAVERLAKTASDHSDKVAVYEVLTAFIRNHAPWPPKMQGHPSADTDPGDLQSRAPDVHAAVTVLGRRDRRLDDPPLDLHGTDLRGAELHGAYLEDANFDDAHMERADLSSAHLTKAQFIDAHLENAYLNGAHLEEGSLAGAHLQGAVLHSTRLEEASLDSADLRWAVLPLVHLERAGLRGAHLQGARLEGAHLEGAQLENALLDGARLAGANLEGANLWRTRLRGSIANDKTKWPTDFDWRGAGVRQAP